MRISDWSSDVCSSDLQRRAGACILAQCPLLAGHPDPLVQVFRIGDERCQHAAGVRHVRNRSPHLRFDQRICGLAMPATDEGEAARLRLFRRWAGKGEEERSEEHTPELQSLMRISYAVFCLKTKTK